MLVFCNSYAPQSVACGQAPEDPTGSSEGHTGTEGMEVETDDPNFICDLPSDLNFGGETIGILYADVGSVDTGLAG